MEREEGSDYSGPSCNCAVKSWKVGPLSKVVRYKIKEDEMEREERGREREKGEKEVGEKGEKRSNIVIVWSLHLFPTY